jgi:hypothetical protein
MTESEGRNAEHGYDHNALAGHDHDAHSGHDHNGHAHDHAAELR